MTKQLILLALVTGAFALAPVTSQAGNPGCGDGILEPGEECEDGNNLDGDCCDANCLFEPPGSSCDDGEFCNGEEICDGAGTCLPGDPIDCSDGTDCTVDDCNEMDDVCENTPNDNLCPDDGMFCTGEEVCDPFAGCVSAGDPCPPPGLACDEDVDLCQPVVTTTTTTTTTLPSTGKVFICHRGRRTLSVSVNAVPDHLAHGDTFGVCPP